VDLVTAFGSEEKRYIIEYTGTGAALADYDGDGDLDLYLVTNFGPNVLYRNNGDGTFTDVTAAAGLEDGRWHSSAAFGNLDADGFPTSTSRTTRSSRSQSRGRHAAPSARIRVLERAALSPRPSKLSRESSPRRRKTLRHGDSSARGPSCSNDGSRRSSRSKERSTSRERREGLCSRSPTLSRESPTPRKPSSSIGWRRGSHPSPGVHTTGSAAR
jgi:hypothetical protein